MVAVFVSHDIRKDEWVCQIPYFPPFQHPSVRFPFYLVLLLLNFESHILKIIY